MLNLKRHADPRIAPVQEARRLALADVDAERDRQDKKWGGAIHDDTHSFWDFIRWIKNYAAWADQMAETGAPSWPKARKRMVQAAALAVAAVEWIDRNHSTAMLDPDARSTADPGGRGMILQAARLGSPEADRLRQEEGYALKKAAS